VLRLMGVPMGWRRRAPAAGRRAREFRKVLDGLGMLTGSRQPLRAAASRGRGRNSPAGSGIAGRAAGAAPSPFQAPVIAQATAIGGAERRPCGRHGRGRDRSAA
jgi:hypothetical protein